MLNGYYVLRYRVLERDNFTCQTCGQHAPDVQLRVIKLERGGKLEESNLSTRCSACAVGYDALRIIRSKDEKIYLAPPIGPRNFREQKILNYLELNSPAPVFDIASETNTTEGCTRVTLTRLLRKNLITRTKYGIYSFGSLLQYKKSV